MNNIEQIENSKTGDVNTFFSKISTSFLEIDSEIFKIREKIGSPEYTDNETYKQELKSLSEQRESIRSMLDNYKRNSSQDQEIKINSAWENLKTASSNLLKKFI